MVEIHAAGNIYIYIYKQNNQIADIPICLPVQAYSKKSPQCTTLGISQKSLPLNLV